MSDDWQDGTNPWTVKAVRRAYETSWFAVDDYEVINPGGKPGVYGVVKPRRSAVGVLPIDDDGVVHLVGQWRFPLGRYSWEMPEGGCEPDEAAEACARRELEEETGLSAAKLEKILVMDLSNSLTNEECTLFLATALSQGEARPEEVEVLERKSAHFSDVLTRVADGRIRDSLTVAAVLRAHHMAIAGEVEPALAKAMLKL
jgi:8-oxo-dGTP pyrophosphatase MutT (NUDIX family)